MFCTHAGGTRASRVGEGTAALEANKYPVDTNCVKGAEVALSTER